MMIKKTVMCALMLAVIALVAGCAEKLKYERWQILTLQSPKAEVETVLGTPNQWKKDDAWMYHNPDKQITVNVEFVGVDKVTYSRWVDPKHGVHTIGKPQIEGGELIESATGKTDINP
ncbi:MAG: hypothetical protein ACYTBZ_21490 [Planctomycetota bacterium]|jgi:hypothetical protein